MIRGERIRWHREQLRMTQQELASQMHVTVQAVSQWENGRTQPDSERIYHLALVLQTTTDALLAENTANIRCWELHDAMFEETQLYASLRAYAQAENLEQMYRALPYAQKCHEGQFRARVRGTQERLPYIMHPLMVCAQAYALGMRDDSVLAAALLHDVCEDCMVLPEDLPFSDEVRGTVRLLTKNKERFEALGWDAALAEYYEGIRTNAKAMLVKCIDRCDNVSSMALSFSPEKMAAYIRETEMYVLPILDELRETQVRWNSAAFLLKYQIRNMLETQKALLRQG